MKHNSHIFIYVFIHFIKYNFIILHFYLIRFLFSKKLFYNILIFFIIVEKRKKWKKGPPNKIISLFVNHHVNNENTKLN